MTEIQDRPRKFVAAFSGWKSLLITSTIVFALAGYAMSFLLPVRYASEVFLIGRPAEVSAEVVPGLTIPLAQQMTRIRQVLLSRTSLLLVIREFNLYDSENDYGSLNERVQQVRDNITVTTIPDDEAGGDIAFTLRFIGTNPETVQKVVSKLVTLFLEHSNQIREEKTFNTTQFLQVQLDQIGKRLTEQGQLMAREKNGKEQADIAVHALEYEMLQARYKTIFDKLEDARMTEYLEGRQKGAQFVIVDPPYLPDRPVGPNRMATAGFGALAGCLFGLMAITGLSRRSRRVLA